MYFVMSHQSFKFQSLEFWHLFTFRFLRPFVFPTFECCIALSFLSFLTFSIYLVSRKGECKNDCDGCINREEGRKKADAAFLPEEVLIRVKLREK